MDHETLAYGMKNWFVYAETTHLPDYQKTKFSGGAVLEMLLMEEVAFLEGKMARLIALDNADLFAAFKQGAQSIYAAPLNRESMQALFTSGIDVEQINANIDKLENYGKRLSLGIKKTKIQKLVDSIRALTGTLSIDEGAALPAQVKLFQAKLNFVMVLHQSDEILAAQRNGFSAFFNQGPTQSMTYVFDMQDTVLGTKSWRNALDATAPQPLQDVTNGLLVRHVAESGL